MRTFDRAFPAPEDEPPAIQPHVQGQVLDARTGQYRLFRAEAKRGFDVGGHE